MVGWWGAALAVRGVALGVARGGAARTVALRRRRRRALPARADAEQVDLQVVADLQADLPAVSDQVHAHPNLEFDARLYFNRV